MKKLLGILVLGLMICNTGNAAKYGEGELKLSPSVVDNFIRYIRGSGNKNPSDFYVTLDGTGYTSWYCAKGPSVCLEGDLVQDILHCERRTGKKCKKFALRRIVKWKNGINPGKGKASKFNSKWTDDQMRAKLTELGFLGQSNSKVEKIDNNQEATDLSSELINDLRALKELYDEGVLTKEEFEKAKKAILNN